MAALMAVHNVPSLTTERYEAVLRRLMDGKDHPDTVHDLPFDGLLVHAAAETEKGLLIFDVFESEEAFARFREIIGPIAAEAGIEEPPKPYPAHTFIVA